MAIRSHVDLSLFLVFVHIPKEQITSAVKNSLEEASAPKDDTWYRMLRSLESRSRQVLFHETYHFWQGLRLPYLFRYALLSQRVIGHAFQYLSRLSRDFRTWSCELPQLQLLDQKEKIGFVLPSQLFYSKRDNLPENCNFKISISPVDLLECAASLAEFQVMHSARQSSDPTLFNRWRKRNPAYIEPFVFVQKFVGVEVALRTCLPLINASFCSTKPVRCFVELLGRLWGMCQSEPGREFLAQPEPCRWDEVFEHFLDKITFEAKADSSADINEERYIRLTLEQWVRGHMGTAQGHVIHPVLGPPARSWLDHVREEPSYKWLLSQPSWAHESVFNVCMTAYSPPLHIIRFHLGDGNDRVVTAGTGGIGAFSSLGHDEPSLKAFVADWSAVYGSVRRAAGVHFDHDQRTCHHSACSFFESNYCNAYPIIPKHYSTCGFSGRMQRLMKIYGGDHGKDDQSRGGT